MKNLNYLFPLLCVLLFTGFLSFKNFENREYSWDMPGYLGGVFKTDRSNKKEIRSAVYSSIEKEASNNEMNLITGVTNDNKSTSVFYKSADAFYEQIPYYQIKHSYNAIIYVFYHYFGFSAPQSVLVPNVIFYFLFGVTIFLIFSEIFRTNRWISAIFTFLVLVFPTSRYLSEIPSPDMMTVFLLALFLLSVIKEYPKFLQFLILINLLLVRPDYVIFILSYWALIFLMNSIKEKKLNLLVVVYSCVTVLIYYGVLKLYDYPGWKDVFYDTFIRRRPYISLESSDFSFADYWKVISTNIINFKKVTLFSSLFLGSVLYFSKDVWLRLFAVLIFINIFVKFAFFPASGELRFFYPFLLMLFIWSIYTISTENKLPQWINKKRSQS